MSYSRLRHISILHTYTVNLTQWDNKEIRFILSSISVQSAKHSISKINCINSISANQFNLHHRTINMGKLLLLIIAVGYATFHSVDSESAENSCVDEQLLEAIESVQTFYRKLDRGEIFTAKLEYEEYKANCDNFRADFTSNATEFVQNFGNCAEIEEYVKFVKKDIVLLKMICNFEDNYRKGMWIRRNKKYPNW